MNILIQDYTDNICSESRLLFIESKKNHKINTYLYNPQDNKSIYDTIDSTNPEYILTDVRFVTPDLVHYLTYNNVGKIIILKIPESISNEDYEKVTTSDFFKKHVFLTINGRGQHKDIRNVNIKPCVDDNIPTIKLKRNIPLAIILNDNTIPQSLAESERSYHCVSFKQNQNADMQGPNISIAGIYGNYDKIIFDSIDSFEQPFFDALYRSKEVYFTSSNKKLGELSEKLFGYNLELNSSVDFEKVKNKIKEKHMPCHRLKTLLSQMSIDQSLFMEVNK